MAFVELLLKSIGLGIILLLSQYALTYLRSPLKKIPGPILAKFSNIWRFLNHYSQTHIETQKKLHEKYGDVVRLGPTTVSIADPSLIKTIYNTRGTFVKVGSLGTSTSDPESHCRSERLLFRQRCPIEWPYSAKHLQHSQQRLQCPRQETHPEAVRLAECHAVGISHE